MNREECIKKIVDTYGIEKQLPILEEECAELITAVSHYSRGRENAYEELAEELADVQIMLWQINYALTKEFYNYGEIDRKIKRQIDRIALREM